MKSYWKILVLILFALAITLGIIQRKALPDFSFGSNTNITKFTDSSDKSLADYYQAGQQISQSANQQASTTVTFLAVGDVNLSRGVATAIQKANDPNLPFAGMTNVLKSTDFNFANLESPFAPKGKEIIGGHTLVFGTPLSYAQSLADFNFKILNLANNHAFDQGLAGINTTNSALDNLNILHEGTGGNLDEAWKPAIINQNGIKICFVGASFSSLNDGGKETNDNVARIQDAKRLKTAIETAKFKCDFVVATMHAGTEYTRKPNDAQKTFAHAAIDDGADIIIGAHPHWVQTIEKYCPNGDSHPPLTPPIKITPSLPSRKMGTPIKGGESASSLPQSASDAGRASEGAQSTCTNPKYIFYSLGNFIFDQSFSQDTSEGLTLKITLSKSGCHPGNTSAAESYPGSSTSNNLDSGSQPASPSQGGMHSAGMECDDNLQGSKTPAHIDSIELLPVTIKNSVPSLATEATAKSILNKIGQIETTLK